MRKHTSLQYSITAHEQAIAKRDAAAARLQALRAGGAAQAIIDNAARELAGLEANVTGMARAVARHQASLGIVADQAPGDCAAVRPEERTAGAASDQPTAAVQAAWSAAFAKGRPGEDRPRQNQSAQRDDPCGWQRAFERSGARRL